MRSRKSLEINILLLIIYIMSYREILQNLGSRSAIKRLAVIYDLS